MIDGLPDWQIAGWMLHVVDDFEWQVAFPPPPALPLTLPPPPPLPVPVPLPVPGMHTLQGSAAATKCHK